MNCALRINQECELANDYQGFGKSGRTDRIVLRQDGRELSSALKSDLPFEARVVESFTAPLHMTGILPV